MPSGARFLRPLPLLRNPGTPAPSSLLWLVSQIRWRTAAGCLSVGLAGLRRGATGSFRTAVVDERAGRFGRQLGGPGRVPVWLVPAGFWGPWGRRGSVWLVPSGVLGSLGPAGFWGPWGLRGSGGLQALVDAWCRDAGRPLWPTPPHVRPGCTVLGTWPHQVCAEAGRSTAAAGSPALGRAGFLPALARARCARLAGVFLAALPDCSEPWRSHWGHVSPRPLSGVPGPVVSLAPGCRRPLLLPRCPRPPRCPRRPPPVPRCPPPQASRRRSVRRPRRVDLGAGCAAVSLFLGGPSRVSVWGGERDRFLQACERSERTAGASASLSVAVRQCLGHLRNRSHSLRRPARRGAWIETLGRRIHAWWRAFLRPPATPAANPAARRPRCPGGSGGSSAPPRWGPACGKRL